MRESFGCRGGVFFKTLGCKVNQAESSSVIESLVQQGIPMVSESDAEVIIIDTCTVTAEADRKVRKYLRRAIESSTTHRVLVTGCMAVLDFNQIARFGDKVELVANKDDIVRRVIELSPASSREGTLGMKASGGPPARTRVSLKVQDGCDTHCTYCIVPLARGNPRSTALRKILSAAKNHVTEGVSELVVTGINVGKYRDSNKDLPGLLKELLDTGVTRLRLSSVEPSDVTASLLEVFANSESICKHLHVPLQSGSERVLLAMKRRYTAREFTERIEHARKVIPGLAVSTDLICGFPGETDDEWQESLSLCRELAFSDIHVFRYSPRSNTIAARMSGRINPSTVARRAREAQLLALELRSKFLSDKLGKVDEVLVEKLNREGMLEGITSDYARVRFAPEKTPVVGPLYPVRMIEVRQGSLVGKLEARS